MSRSRLFSHSRFDGGMTHNNRDTSDLSKSSFISHLDIYRENHRAYVMPGYISDNGFADNVNGLKTYDVQAFLTRGDTTHIYALGKKSDGTGSKIFQRNFADSQWIIPTTVEYQGEGTADLVNYPFFLHGSSTFGAGGDLFYPVKVSGTQKVAQHGPNAGGNYNSSWSNWVGQILSGRTAAIRGFTGAWYLTKGGITGLSLIASGGVTENIKTTGGNADVIGMGDYQIGIGMNFIGHPRRTQFLLWDSASLLADQNNAVGKGATRAVGYTSGIWSLVTNSSTEALESNGKEEMSVKIVQGESVDTLYKLYSVNPFTFDATKHDIFSLNDYYGQSMLFYGRVEVATGVFKQGIWAVGKGGIDSQFGVSMLLDTDSLGVVRNANTFGNSMYIIHGGDGSVSRLDNFETGTFDVPAYIETLWYGADTPFQKQLEGVSVVTENLPAGGQVEVQYRKDENSAWVSMGVSDTDDKEVHNFTKASGVPIGKFKEIQFKIILTGKIALKSYLVSITEEDSLSFNV